MERALIAGVAAVVFTAGALALATGPALADTSYGPHRWCTGQSMEYPTGPFGQVEWDMGVCHTW